MFGIAAKNAALNGIAALITHISAHTTVPDAVGSGEVAGGSYARQGVIWDPAAGALVSNNGAVAIQVPAGNTVIAFGYWSALVAGTFYGHALVGNTIRGVGTVDGAGVIADAIQSAGHGLTNGSRVVFYPVLGEALPAGLLAGVAYYVVQAAADAFEVSSTLGGPSLDITGQGELYWANCVPVTFDVAGTLTIEAGQLTLSAAVI